MRQAQIRTLKELRMSVEKELEDLHRNIIRDCTVNSDLADLLIDISSKLMDMLMLKGRRCYVDVVGKAYDLARDIEHAGKFAHRDDIAVIGEDVVQMILGYMRAHKDEEIFGMEEEV